MTDQSIFNNQPATEGEQPRQQPETPNTSVQIPEEAQALIGEGKKYKDYTTALAALAPAQNHIKALEDEMAELKAELEKRKSVSESVEQLMDSTKEQQADQPVPGLDESTVNKLVDERLTAKSLEETYKANETKVVTALADKFKDKAQEVYNSKAQELGMDVADLNALVRKSPQAALNLFGVTSSQAASPSSINQGVNTVALNDQTNTVGKGYKYYKELRKTNPRMYSKLYLQMQAEALKAESMGIDYFKNT